MRASHFPKFAKSLVKPFAVYTVLFHLNFAAKAEDPEAAKYRAMGRRDQYADGSNPRPGDHAKVLQAQEAARIENMKKGTQDTSAPPGRLVPVRDLDEKEEQRKKAAEKREAEAREAAKNSQPDPVKNIPSYAEKKRRERAAAEAAKKTSAPPAPSPEH